MYCCFKIKIKIKIEETAEALAGYHRFLEFLKPAFVWLDLQSCAFRFIVSEMPSQENDVRPTQILFDDEIVHPARISLNVKILYSVVFLITVVKNGAP